MPISVPCQGHRRKPWLPSERKDKRLCLTGLQLLCFLKSPKDTGRLSEKPLRCAVVELNHLFTRESASVCDFGGYIDRAVFFTAPDGLDRKLGVRKTVTEGVVNLLLRPLKVSK